MARKQTNTADFFPHRVNHGKTIFKLEAKYGNDGYAFLFKLCEMLGAAENHFLDLSDPGDWEFFVVKMRMEESKCTSILNDLLAWGKLDKELYETYKVIWYEKFLQGLSTLYLNRKREMPVRPHFYNSNTDEPIIPTVEVHKVEESKEEESIPPISPKGDDEKEEIRTAEEVEKVDLDMVEFEAFRQLYPGSKRGLETEFAYFKKHKDWKVILETLKEKLEYQIEGRAARKKANQFVPDAWQNLKTYIYQRSWEIIYIVDEAKVLEIPSYKLQLAAYGL